MPKREKERKKGREKEKRERGDWERERGREMVGGESDRRREKEIAQKEILITQLRILFGDKRREKKKELQKLLDDFITVHLKVFSTQSFI